LFFEDFDDGEFFSYDYDSSFYTIFEDFYESFSFHKLKNTQFDNFSKIRPYRDFLGKLQYSDYFDIFMELGFPFFGMDKKFKILDSLKDDFLKIDLLEELKMF